MLKPLLCVIALGAGVGMIWPAGRAHAPAKAAAAAASAAPKETLLKRHEDGHFYADVEVNGELVHFLIDTGASGVALTEEDAARVGLKVSPAEYEAVGMGAGGRSAASWSRSTACRSTARRPATCTAPFSRGPPCPCSARPISRSSARSR
jgi:hypothetical protein